MNMKRFTAMITAAAMMSTMAFSMQALAADNLLEQIKEDGVLQVCMEPAFAPYEFINTQKTGQDQYEGSDIGLAKYIADDLGVELEIVPLEFSAVIASIVAKKYPMAISALAYTPERAEAVLLSDSYRDSASTHGFIVRKEDYDTYTCLDDLTGKTVAYQNGSVQDMYTNEQVKDVVTKPFDSVNNAVLALQSGKCDAVAVNYENGEMFVAANPDLVMASFLFNDTEDTNVVAVPLGEQELIDEVNKCIAEVKEQGLYTQWWDEAVEQAKALGID